MSVLVFAESPKGRFKKAAFEIVHYGHMAANALKTECTAVVIGVVDDPAQLGKYGALKVIQVNYDGDFDDSVYTKIISEIASKTNAEVIAMNHSSTGKALAGRLTVALNAGVVTGANSVPLRHGEAIDVKKPVFSGKAIVTYRMNTPKKIISLMGNAFPPKEVGSPCPVETMSVGSIHPKVKVRETKTVEGTIPLPEAELVVSAGRGMKGPENWGIIEELAKAIGATTACSRPVADTGWRPHHEHVGQTGIAIRPNLYIAAGISGAIQHLAGVNSSKCIVVINKDPEAPFFKAATYGVCADLFDVVPRLTKAFKKYKSEQ